MQPNNRPAMAGTKEPLDALVGDLQRYSILGGRAARREFGRAVAALRKQPSDANRLRVAVLHALTYDALRTTPDERRFQRTLEFFGKAAQKDLPWRPTPITQLAAMLLSEINERITEVRDAQLVAEEGLRVLLARVRLAARI